MKTLKTMTILAALSAVSGSSALAQEAILLTGEGLPAHLKGPATIQSTQLREVEPIVLVEFDLSNGNEVRFYGVPEDNELLFAEITDAGREDFVLDPEASAAEVFLELAPADLPVPSMIADTEPELFKWHQKVDVVSSAVPVDVGPRRALTKAGSGSCAVGQPGADFFEDHHCNTLGGSGYGKSEKYCEEAADNSIPISTHSRRRTTYSRMASCGGGDNRVKHYYSTVSGWHNFLNLTFDPQKIITLATAKSGVKRYRAVVFEDDQPAGWVRGWAIFHNQISG